MHKSVWIVGFVTLIVCFAAGIIMSRTQFNIQDVESGLSTTSSKSGDVQTKTPDPPALETNAPETPKDSYDIIPNVPGFERDRVVLQPNMPPQVVFNLDDAFEADDGRLQVDLPGGYRAHLTLVPEMQSELESIYRRYGVPHGGFAAIEPKTGRVLALVSEESSDDPKGDVAVRAFAPSASLFKVVTSAALIEDSGLKSSSKTCYIGETSKRPSDAQLKSSKGRDRQCTTFAEAFGESNNAVFGNLSYKHLNPNQLETWAARFAYNEPIPFQVPVSISSSRIPKDKLEMARAAAGFWSTRLSPLHASLIMSAVGNGGVMMRPNLIERLYDRDGNLVYEFKASPYKRVMEERTARELTSMMAYTTSVGTGRKYFHNAKGLPKTQFTTGGKTGTLSDSNPYLMYSWFAGIAPLEGPRVALAALVCNPMKWRIKGSYAALEGLKAFVRSTDLMKQPEKALAEENDLDPVESKGETENPTEDLRAHRDAIIPPKEDN